MVVDEEGVVLLVKEKKDGLWTLRQADLLSRGGALQRILDCPHPALRSIRVGLVGALVLRAIFICLHIPGIFVSRPTSFSRVGFGVCSDDLTLSNSP